jgi:rSAM/selenodomain-associated transferase 1
MKTNALILFARRPELGKVKTRLAAGIGEERALEFYKKLLAHTRDIARATETADAKVFLTDASNDEFWTAFDVFQQPPGDLGQRMQSAFETVFEQGYEKAVIISSDCPDLTAAEIEKAFYLLSTVDVVMGPATDGGYYLLGMNTVQKSLFSEIHWSTGVVAAETMAIAEKAGLQLQQLSAHSDIDTMEDLPAGWL